MRGVPPLQVSIGQLTRAAVLIAPLGLHPAPRRRRRPRRCARGRSRSAPSGSGVAYLLYFAIIASAGASRAILVTYLVPAFALAYGAVLLDETVDRGLAWSAWRSVLTGTALATGAGRRVERRLASDHRERPQVLRPHSHPCLASGAPRTCFIKVGVDGGLSPGAADGRAGAARRRRRCSATSPRPSARRRPSRACARPGVRRSCSASLNAAIPFWLVAWGETHIDSGAAGIAQATVPIFSLLIGLRFLPHERIGAAAGRRRLSRARRRGASSRAARPRAVTWTVAGTLAVVLASVFYASAGIYGQLRLTGRSGPVARDRLDARGRRHAAAARDRRASHLDAHRRRDRLAAAPVAARHGARAARPLPRDRALRRPPPQPRHLSPARLRARLRGAHPRRGDHGCRARSGSR